MKFPPIQSNSQKYTLLAIWFYISAGMYRNWIWLLDTFTLMLHEAGHLVIGLFSNTLMVYGGTIFQLAFPVVTYYHFKKFNNINGIYFSCMWFAGSIHNVAVYLKDARAKELPLIGGLDPELYHDWSEILSRWNLLKFDLAIGNLIIFLSWIIMFYILYNIFRNNDIIKRSKRIK